MAHYLSHLVYGAERLHSITQVDGRLATAHGLFQAYPRPILALQPRHRPHIIRHFLVSSVSGMMN